MTSSLKGEGLGDKAKRRCYRTYGVGAVVGSKCSGQQSLFSIKENWIFSMTRHHAESNINVLLSRNLPIECGVRL